MSNWRDSEGCGGGVEPESKSWSSKVMTMASTRLTWARAGRCVCSGAQAYSRYGLEPNKWQHDGGNVADYRGKSETTHD